MPEDGSYSLEDALRNSAKPVLAPKDDPEAVVVQEKRPEPNVGYYSGDAGSNLAEGLVRGLSNTADELLTDPSEWWNRHSKNTEKHMGQRLQRAQDEPFIGTAKNAGQGALDMLLFLPQMAVAFNDAAHKGPDAVATLTEAIPGAMATGLGYIANNPADAMIADPVGTAATVFSAVRLAKPATLAVARNRVPPGERNRFDSFVELAHENADKFRSLPIARSVDDAAGGVKNLLNKPLPKTEKRGKTVKKREAGDRLDIGGGAEPLRVGELIGSALKSGAATHVASGGLLVAPTVAAMATYPAFLWGVSRLRASRSKHANQFIGGWERLVKTVSGASDMGTESAIAAVMSQAAKADSVLGAAIRDINHQVASGNITSAVSKLNNLSDNNGVINTVISSHMKQGTAGDVISRVAKASGKESPNYAALHPALKDTVDKAIAVISETLGNDKVGPETMAKIQAIANMDSVAFGGAEPMRNALRVSAEKQLGRKLKGEERNHLDRRARQYAGLALIESGPVSGKIRIKGPDEKGVVLDLRQEFNRAISDMPASRRNEVVGELIVDAVSHHRSSIRSKAHREALEREAHRVTSKRTREALNAEKQASGTPSYGSREVDIMYAGDLVRAVVGRGDATPLIAPMGIDLKSIARILFSDPETAARAAIGESLAANPAMLKQATYRVRTLARELDDSSRYKVNTAIASSSALRDIESGQSFRALLSDLESDGVPTQGMLNNVKVLSDIEKAHADVGQMSMRQPLADTFWWLDTMSRDANPLTRWAHTTRGAVKLGLTAYSTAVHTGNALANIVFTAADRGHSVPRVMASNALTAKKLYAHLKGDRSKMTKLDQELFGMISEMGFRLGDMSVAELRSFIRSSDVPFAAIVDGRVASRAKSALSREIPGVSHAVRGTKFVTKKAKETYSLGDTIPKANEAYHSLVYLRKMMDELEPGKWIEADTHAGLHRRLEKGADGAWYTGGKRATSKQIRDFQMGFARRRANERFKDFSSRPGLMRALEYVPFGNTFSHWALKAKGVGDPGMGTILARSTKGVRTNSTRLGAKIATQEAYLSARRSLMIQMSKALDSEDRKRFAEIGSKYNKGLGMMLAMASSRPGNMQVRNLQGIASLGPQIELWNTGALWLNALLVDGERSKLRRSASGVHRDSNMQEAISAALGVIEVEGGVLENISNLLLEKPGSWKRKKSAEFFKKGFIGGTPAEFLSFAVAVLKEEGIIGSEADDTYYDYLNRTVPSEQRRSKAADLFNKLAGALGTKEKSVITPRRGKTKHVWNRADYANDLETVSGNLRENYWEPVAKKYGPLSSESVEAFRQLKAYHQEYMTSINKGYKSVFGKYPPIGIQRRLLVTDKNFRHWVRSVKTHGAID